MNPEKGIAIACFTGGALGALLAIQLGYFWWVGILIGGAVGYVFFRFKEAIGAVRRVWKSLPNARTATEAARTAVWNFVRTIGVVLAILCFAFSILIMIVGLAMSLVVGAEMSTRSQIPPTVTEAAGIAGQYWVMGGAVLAFTAVLLLFFVLLSVRDRKGAFRTILSCFLLTPLVLPFTIGYAIVSPLVPYACKGFVRLGVLSSKAARQTFILVHSELRLLCMTDAMIGALAGYCCGNALIGGFVGAACGLANYKLVSVKWLKLVKA
jgi:hypothetical protein